MSVDAIGVFNDWLIRAMTGDEQATVPNLIRVLQEGEIERDEDGFAITPNGDTVVILRAKVAGWHFSKEALTEGERDILYVAEQLLAELDRISGGYLR